MLESHALTIWNFPFLQNFKFMCTVILHLSSKFNSTGIMFDPDNTINLPTLTNPSVPHISFYQWILISIRSTWVVHITVS